MRVINDTLVLCLSPPLSGGDVKASTSVEVELSLSDGHGALSFTRSGLRFDYAREPELVSAEPALGPVTGNTEVLLAVRFLRLPVAGEAEAAASRGAGPPLLCAFGEVGSAADQAARVPAALAVRTAPGGEPSRGEWAANSDISLVSCVAPAALNSTETGIVPVRFSQNYGADWSLLTGVTFEYQRAPTLLDLSPRFGPAMAGGTAVRVTGSGFVDRAGLSCRVDGNYVVPAQFLSGTGVVCRVPPLLALGGGATPAGSLPRALRIEVSNDGRSFFGNGTFWAVPDEAVTQLIPRRVPEQGGSALLVWGKNFLNTTSLACRFEGRHAVRALFLSPELLSCVVPNLAGTAASALRVVAVEVANNGADWVAVDADGALDLARDCAPGRYCAGGNELRAPNGTFVPDGEAGNFSLCRPGTFQPRAGQSACLSCPVGFVCPDHGLAKPVLCPPGMVCDRLGLASPSSACPRGHVCAAGTKSADPFEFQDHAAEDGAGTPFAPLDGLWSRDADSGLSSFLTSAYAVEWPWVRRAAPATGFARALHWPAGATGPLRPPPVVPAVELWPAAERPRPCPVGHFCNPGTVAGVEPAAGNLSTPQPCHDAFFCPAGSSRPEGQGACPTGHYCAVPVNSSETVAGALVATLCPEGHQCPGVGNTKPTPCYPGTYNRFVGAANCTACPPGHVCPGYARTEPLICPAGFVCLSEALSAPVVQCPAGYFCEEGTLTLVLPGHVDSATAASRGRPLHAARAAAPHALSRDQHHAGAPAAARHARQHAVPDVFAGAARAAPSTALPAGHLLPRRRQAAHRD